VLGGFNTVAAIVLLSGLLSRVRLHSPASLVFHLSLWRLSFELDFRASSLILPALRYDLLLSARRFLRRGLQLCQFRLSLACQLYSPTSLEFIYHLSFWILELDFRVSSLILPFCFRYFKANAYVLGGPNRPQRLILSINWSLHVQSFLQI
jgi:hypothetical protein